MRVTITDANKSLEIEQWFCEREGIPRVREATLLRRTDRAILLNIKGKEHWIPLSLITWMERKEKGLDCYGV